MKKTIFLFLTLIGWLGVTQAQVKYSHSTQVHLQNVPNGTTADSILTRANDGTVRKLPLDSISGGAGDYIPLSGTEVESPITGSLEIDENTEFYLEQPWNDSNNFIRIHQDEGISLGAENSLTGLHSGLYTSEYSLTLSSENFSENNQNYMVINPSGVKFRKNSFPQMDNYDFKIGDSLVSRLPMYFVDPGGLEGNGTTEIKNWGIRLKFGDENHLSRVDLLPEDGLVEIRDYEFGTYSHLNRLEGISSKSLDGSFFSSGGIISSGLNLGLTGYQTLLENRVGLGFSNEAETSAVFLKTGMKSILLDEYGLKMWNDDDNPDGTSLTKIIDIGDTYTEFTNILKLNDLYAFGFNLDNASDFLLGVNLLGEVKSTDDVSRFLEGYSETGTISTGYQLDLGDAVNKDNHIQLTDGSIGSITITTEILNLDTQMGGFLINTAPAPSSASATGIEGEIRITSDYIYVCIAPNTWVRAELSTW